MRALINEKAQRPRRHQQGQLHQLPRSSYWLICLVAISAFVGTTGCNRAVSLERRENLIVSAAADLAPAFAEIGKLFERRSNQRVTFNFGSTGQLAQQIEQGAPVDVFAAANVSFVDELEGKGLIVPGTRAIYGQGRLTIWTRADRQLKLTSIGDLASPEVKRIAIANPEHAPYGVAAREALESARIWDRVKPRLVYGENIRQTLQYAETGNVDAAIVALSLSLGSNGRWMLVPDDLHRPLNQALAVIKGSRNEAAATQFAALVTGEGRGIMRKYGFILPGEEPLR